MPKAAPAQSWVRWSEALDAFVRAASGTQGQGHINPMHSYVAARLVLEGGFHPREVSPRPPFSVRTIGSGSGARHLLEADVAVAGSGDRTVLGGLKTKDVDVVVTKDGIGPCLAVSMKGTLNAFRNLTNRMEEAVGDCANLHISYPALVYGFLHLLRGTYSGRIPKSAKHFLDPDEKTGGVKTADCAVLRDECVVDSITRYHDVMSRLTRRIDIRDEPSRYEAVAIVMADGRDSGLGRELSFFPVAQSQLRFDTFFETLLRQYDLRFVYSAPLLEPTTRRLCWDPESSVLAGPLGAEFRARVSGS